MDRNITNKDSQYMARAESAIICIPYFNSTLRRGKKETDFRSEEKSNHIKR
jgi:hypothetical protein